MGMIGNYYMTDEDTIRKIRQGEISVESLIYDDNDEIDEDKTLDIDKAWHAIHFTLTGSMDEGDEEGVLFKTVFSGNLVNDEDIGYGPAMEITADEVREIHLAIKDISRDAFRADFNVNDMIEMIFILFARMKVKMSFLIMFGRISSR